MSPKQSESKRNYEVGYGKPPRDGQFVKGQSGNPYGRPKNKPSIKLMLGKILDEKIPTRENGEKKVISKFEAMLKQLVNKAVTGDHKALQTVVRIQSDIEAEANGTEALMVLTKEQDEKLIANVIRRVQSSPDNINSKTIEE
jgi:hypothetical protein